MALRHMDAFYDELTKRRGLAKKTVLEGFSRGGLFAYNWAAAHPDRVACIYADSPVCDFKSWPGGKGKGRRQPRRLAKRAQGVRLDGSRGDGL